MERPLAVLKRLAVLAGVGVCACWSAVPCRAQAVQEKTPALWVGVNEPITEIVFSEVQGAALRYVDRAVARGVEPILVFEFTPAAGQHTSSDLWMCSRLAEFLSTQLGRAKLTIAYVPRSLSGYAILPVMACDEIVLGDEASLGPITPTDQAVHDQARAALTMLAKRKGRDLTLLMGLLDPKADLREVVLGDQRRRFVLAAELEDFRRQNNVIEEKRAWEGGQQGVLSPERARALQVAALLANNRNKLITTYNLDAQAADLTRDGTVRPVLIQVEGPIDTLKQQYIKRRIAQAMKDGVNLIILRLNSEGGQFAQVADVAEQLGNLPRGVRTVAFIDDRALGLSSLLPLACDEIVMRQGAGPRMGGLASSVGGRGDFQQIPEKLIKPLSDDARKKAREKIHPEAVAHALMDRSVELIQARDNESGGAVILTSDEMLAQPKRFAPLRTLKAAGEVLVIDAQGALDLRLASQVVGSLDELLAARGLKGIRIDQPSWVEALVDTLNSSWMSGLLLFIGLFMLILELKLPGVGLPAIISGLSFLLFFWSHYLGGTADNLEILLFLAGLVAIALELFVFPGFGIFGLSGILLVLGSVIMASHTFVWPTGEYEFRQMSGTLTQLTVAIVGVVVAAIVLGRYFPSMPLFRRMILVPQSPGDGTDKEPASFESTESLAFLLGERGRTTSVCRPIGKARFGEMLIDVIADGFFIEAETPVEVIEVRGTQVLVKRI